MVRTLLIKVLLYNEEAEPSAVNRVIQYLHTNMAKKITLDELVTISYMSKSYLEKQFKKETGKTIIEYLNQIRIDAAKMLMMTTTKTATEISYSVGFVSPKYFFRIFKQITGMTPTAFAKYKKQVQGEDGEVTQEAVQQ